MTSLGLQDKEGSKFHYPICIAEVCHTDNVFRDMDYITKEHADIELVDDDRISEHEINNLNEDQEQYGDD